MLNRDVGFIAPGQRVVVKLEAYPFTRHGHLEGEVEQLSPDAIADEARGLVFPARVKILSSRLREVNHWTGGSPSGILQPGREEGRMVEPGRDRGAAFERDGSRGATFGGVVQVGMAAQVEIITGRRSVLSYVLSPIARARDEAGRER